MFRTTSNFDKLLDKATSNLLMEPDWPTILQLCDLLRQNDVQPKYAFAAIKKKLVSTNPHTAMFALQVIESMVKNCGSVVHEELTSKPNCELLHELAKVMQHENVRQKLLELIQAWTFAFRNNSKYSALKDTMNLMKAEGYKFPTLRESDAMFCADSAPEWMDGDVCHRCRIAFNLVQRKHHCRACGQVFCNQCSQKTTTLPKFGIEKEVRVCDTCYDQVTKPLTAPAKAVAVKQEEAELPAEYLKSSLAQQSQLPPPRKTEEELREEEELQLALALSQSEAEAKEKHKLKGTSTLHTVVKDVRPRDPTPSPPPPEEPVNPELARYLNRSFWETRQNDSFDTNNPTSPSAPATAPVQNNEPKYLENGITDIEMNEFVNTLKSQVEIFINRMKSNSSRGRSIANDSSVQTLFMNITAMHSQLLRYIQQHDDNRLHYERLQDKLTQVKDARAALDALREEHHEKLRRQAEEAERQRQLQMAHKLDIMRKKKQEYLQYQRQLALQRIQEQEREMQMRQEQQKQQYLMGWNVAGGSPAHAPQFPPQAGIPPLPYSYQYGPMMGQPHMMQGPPQSAPQIGQQQNMPTLRSQSALPGLSQGMQQGTPTGIPQQGQLQGLPQAGQPMPLSQGLPPGIGRGMPPPQNMPQGMPSQQVPQGIPQQSQVGQPIPPQATNSQPISGPPPQGIPPQQFQQPGAPPASPQIPHQQQNGDAQTAELISFD